MAQATAPAPVRASSMGDRRVQEAITGYTFISPAFLVLVVFLILPMLTALYFSLTDWDGITPLNRAEPYEMVGLENYQRLLDYIVPDKVHVLHDGRIIRTGDKSLALELEQRGYDWITDAYKKAGGLN